MLTIASVTSRKYITAVISLVVIFGTISAQTPSSASFRSEGSGPTLTPAVKACIKKVLSPADFAIVLVNPQKLATKAKAKAFACFQTQGKFKNNQIATSGTWITANPVDLTHVTAISAFRSCSGHDYSGLNIGNQPESDRSMKHYVLTDVPLENTGSVMGYAPFDGVVSVESEQFPLGKQIQITSLKFGWIFVFFHGDPLVATGASVKAGQSVIAWPPANALTFKGNLSTGGSSFDIALKSIDGRYESPLLHMNPTVAATWAAKGFTASAAIISKTQRDATPCNGVYNDQLPGTGWIAAAK